MDTQELKNESAKLEPALISNRRYLHAHAETGFDLKNTLAFVKEELTYMGYTPSECGKSGLVALAGGKREGKTFLIRADMDALPIREEADIDFCSTNGSMHACGHDMHTAMLLGAAHLLKKHEDEIQGTIKLMFQPAEEILEGAKDMIHAGLLKNPQVDGALMIHIMAGIPFDAGAVIVSSPGISAPAADYFEIRICGKGCHGSMPYTGIDPTNAAAHILIALQEIQTRELAMTEPAALTIGTINAGTAANVIPDTVLMSGSLRAYEEGTRAFIKNRMTEITKYTAKTFRAEAEVHFTNGCPALLNDKDLSVCAEKYVTELLGADHTFSVARLNADTSGKGTLRPSGSEDFSYVSQEVPSVMLALAAGQPEKGFRYPLHHPKACFDEEALSAGSAVYAYTAMRWLEDHKK